MGENYFIRGSDFLVHQKIRKLKTKFAGDNIWDTEYPGDWQEFADNLTTQGMFSEKRVFVVDFNDLSRWQGTDTDSLERLLPVHCNVVIFYCIGKPDKRTILYNTVSRHCREEVVSDPRDLTHWLLDEANLRGGQISRPAAKELLLRAGSDMQLLSNELDKLLSYSADIDVDSVRLLAVNSAQSGIFQLVDAVVNRKTATGLEVAENLYTGSSSLPYLLQMLARQYRYLFQIVFYKKQGFGAAEVGGRLQLHSYAFELMWKQANSLSLTECADALQLLADADYKFKTGSYPGLALLDTLIVKLSKKL